MQPPRSFTSDAIQVATKAGWDQYFCVCVVAGFF